MPLIKIDAREYERDMLSDEASANLASLRFVDGEIERLNKQLAVAGMTRSAYAPALQRLLPPND